MHNPALEQEIARRDGTGRDSTGDIIRAYAPYLIIIAVLSIAQIPAIKEQLAESPWTTTFDWPGLNVVTPDGEAVSSQTFNFNWLPAAGTLLLDLRPPDDAGPEGVARPGGSRGGVDGGSAARGRS